jgi:hypothetical protein
VQYGTLFITVLTDTRQHVAPCLSPLGTRQLGNDGMSFYRSVCSLGNNLCRMPTRLTMKTVGHQAFCRATGRFLAGRRHRSH